MSFFAQEIYHSVNSSLVIGYAMFEGGSISGDTDAHERFVGIVSGFDPFDTNYNGQIDGFEGLSNVPIISGFLGIFSGVQSAELQKAAFNQLALETFDPWFATQANLTVVSLAADIIENGSVAILDAMVGNLSGLAAGSLAANLASGVIGQLIIREGAEEAFAALAGLVYSDGNYSAAEWVLEDGTEIPETTTQSTIYVSTGVVTSGTLGSGDNVFVGTDVAENFDFGEGFNVAFLAGGNDTIQGGHDGNALDGGDGDDYILTGTGDDTLVGGEGDDTLDGSWGNDALFGGDGNDTIIASLGIDSVDGGKGDDYVRLDDVGGDTLTGGDGMDTFRLGLHTSTHPFEETVTIDPFSDAPIILSDGTQFSDFEIFEYFAGEGSDDVTIIVSDAEHYIGYFDGGDNFSGATVDTIRLDLSSLENDVLVNLVSFGVVSGNQYTRLGDFADFEAMDITGGRGDDRLLLNSPANTPDSQSVFGGAGDDTITTKSRSATIFGGKGDDTISPSFGASVIDGGRGNDVISLLWDGVKDVVTGGAGNDTLKLNIGLVEHPGKHTFIFDPKSNKSIKLDDGTKISDFEIIEYVGGQSSDEVTVRFTSGSDFLGDYRGGFGDADTIHLDFSTYKGNAVTGQVVSAGVFAAENAEGTPLVFYSQFEKLKITGSASEDVLTGGNASDTINGRKGADEIEGGDGADKIRGQKGADEIAGGAGNDNLKGDSGKDKLKGGGGKDILNGGTGNDTLKGDKGSDTFVFSGKFGKDTVVDFVVGEQGDKIDLSGVSTIKNYNDLTKNHLVSKNDNTVIEDKSGNSVLLENVDVTELVSTNFLF